MTKDGHIGYYLGAQKRPNGALVDPADAIQNDTERNWLRTAMDGRTCKDLEEAYIQEWINSG